MKKSKFLLLCLILSVSFSLYFAIQKIQHKEPSIILLEAGVLLYIIFFITAVYQIRANRNLSAFNQIAWIACLLFLGYIGGIFYLLTDKGLLRLTK